MPLAARERELVIAQVPVLQVSGLSIHTLWRAIGCAISAIVDSTRVTDISCVHIDLDAVNRGTQEALGYLWWSLGLSAGDGMAA